MVYHLIRLLATLFIFHTSEFGLALVIHGCHRVSWSSFLFSRDYTVAMAAGILEHLLESVIVPGLKDHPWISNGGLVLVVAGELVRKAGILTARHGFTHDIKTQRQDDHVLVTHGIYSFVRHPGYAGFFMWSIGTQVMMLNPLCTVAYTLVTWRFFHSRIVYEEYFLKRFFGSRYDDYARQVPSGLPFIK